jgi:uncharacterized protein (DUF1778 family)
MIDNLMEMTDRKLESVFVRLSIKERKELEKRAKVLDRKLAEFVRLAALKVAREGQTLEPPPGPESETEE